MTTRVLVGIELIYFELIHIPQLLEDTSLQEMCEGLDTSMILVGNFVPLHFPISCKSYFLFSGFFC